MGLCPRTRLSCSGEGCDVRVNLASEAASSGWRLRVYEAGLSAPRLDRLAFRSVLHLPGVFECVPGEPAGRVGQVPAAGRHG